MKALENRERGSAGQYQGAARMKGWQTKKLGDLVEVQNGYAFSSKDYSESGHFLMRIGNVQNGYISTADPKFIKLPSDGSLRRFVLSEDDILVSLTGNVGRIGVIQESHLPAALNQRVARISIRKDSPATRELLLLFLCSDWFREELISAGHGAAQQNVSTKDLVEIEIPVPPLAEQQRIVGLLDEAFEGLATAKANAAKNLQNARALFESHLQSVFTQRGPGWVEKPLGEISDFKNGLNYNKSSGGQTLPVVGVADFQDNYFVPLSELQSATIDGDLADNYAIQPNDILTVRSNGSKHLVGRCMLVGDVDEVVSYSGFIIRIRFDAKIIFPQYLLHFMKCQVTRDILTAGGGGANITNINQEKLSTLLVPLPPYRFQIKLAAALDHLREETQRLARLYERKVAALEALKKTLLHQAFSGAL